MKRRGLLLLEDGSVYEGEIFGKEGIAGGELVFSTSMTGYQEAVTDPSYKGQILLFTYPLIGNYGACRADLESEKVQVEGVVVREIAPYYSSWRAEESFESFLARHGVVGISGVDTRAITRKLRNYGTMRAVVGPAGRRKELEERLAALPPMEGQNLVDAVTRKEPEYIRVPGAVAHLAVYDFGIKRSIIEWLKKQGFSLTIFPARTPAEAILEGSFDGVFLSNGPGDPAAVSYAIENVKKLLGKLPVVGICLGHQITALALGGRTYKLKFGHRGINHPVKDLRTGKVEITTQNHGFAVDASSLPSHVEITHVSLNDGTVEGLAVEELRVFTVQYHPEASPGPNDSKYIFSRFREIVLKGKKHA